MLTIGTERGLIMSEKEQLMTTVGEVEVAALHQTKVMKHIQSCTCQFRDLICRQQAASAGDLSRPGKGTGMNVRVMEMNMVCAINVSYNSNLTWSNCDDRWI